MTLLSIIVTIALGCYIYNTVTTTINIRKQNKLHEKRLLLIKDINTRLYRSVELVNHIQDLIDDGDIETASLLDENLQSNIKKIEKLEKELNNICI